MKKIKLTDYHLETFLSDLNELHIELSEKQLSQFLAYYEMLVEWNKVMNLTAITDFDEVCKKHFIDSLSLVKAYDVIFSDDIQNGLSSVSVIDVGTGAGFPGIFYFFHKNIRYFIS